VRHSQATRLEVELRSTRSGLSLSIFDNGQGFDLNASHYGHFGLVGMRERACEIGAALDITTQPGCGVRIEVRLPMGASTAKSNRTANLEHQLHQ
jgi:signal transduction histidine kinase